MISPLLLPLLAHFIITVNPKSLRQTSHFHLTQGRLIYSETPGHSTLKSLSVLITTPRDSGARKELGGRGHSVSKVFALQARGPEFDHQNQLMFLKKQICAW